MIKKKRQPTSQYEENLLKKTQKKQMNKRLEQLKVTSPQGGIMLTIYRDLSTQVILNYKYEM